MISITLRLVLIFVSLLALLYIIRKIRFSKLQIEYAIFWILCALMFVVIAIFPGIVVWISQQLGMMSPVNVVYIVIIAILLLKVFMMTIELSQLENKVKELVQKIALEEKKNGKSKSTYLMDEAEKK